MRCLHDASLGSTYIIIAPIGVVFTRSSRALRSAPRIARGALIRMSVQLFPNVARRHMKYLVVAIVLAAIAGVEVLHAFSADDAPDALMCTAPQARMEAFREMLLLHLYSH